jgi:hypothetical protein
LRTTGLTLIKLNLTTNPPQHLYTTHTYAGPQLIDETRDEQRDLHNISHG